MKEKDGAFFKERREEVHLSESIFSDICCDEFKEIDKHDIIIKISEILGTDPNDLHKAEEVFEHLKFHIARYVLHHEYSKESAIRSRLLLWLDSKTNPGKVKALSNFMDKYLK